ncbi:hypothetical protein K488DRAFT_55124 [Vararia minispora EC-137]|uniref:Uncharacterized protein n=1 Tax=Vararia minispora EC-137 TaxID=1314806 RepID=A0ACB8QEJ0_9AGAM|nr:hypothetical protein K488DRAFT_55124 [Vararia minispora EC-137]
MSLKAELETWAAALKAYDEEDFEKALEQFSRIADSSKILTNMGLIYATLGEHEAAVEQFIAATGLDQYLAVAYFQCGVSNFLLGRYDLASKDFEGALLYLRGNQSINYTQLGLAFTLFSAEVLFNKGLSLIYMGQAEEGMLELQDAARQKATEEHNVIDEAIRDRGEGYTVFSIPVGVLYRPSEMKLKNAKTRDFLGKAKLVATENPNEAYTTFSGVTRLKQGISPQGVYVEQKPLIDLNRTGSLVRSVTEPPARPKPSVSDAPSAGLSRANTMLSVPSNARERITPGAPPSEPSARSMTPARSNTIGGATPVRGLSIRRPGGDIPAPSPPPKPRIPGVAIDARMTEFYDSYIDDYAGPGTPTPPVPPMPPVAVQTSSTDRVADWARSNTGVPARAPSSFGGSMRSGTVKRRPTRRMAQSVYDEEEEGYVTGSGDWEEYELMKIRVKIHFEDDVRGMALDPATPYQEFLDRVAAKFDLSPRSLRLKFKDEDGGKVSLQDGSDYELAIETARESAKGRPEGKLEMWCEQK